MGTQQILLIVLSVIIVGVAVSVGIQMFQTQQDSAEEQAVRLDLQNYGTQIMGYMNSPASMGGGKDATAFDPDAAQAWIGWNLAGDATAYENNNASYEITADGANATLTATYGDGETLAVTITEDGVTF